MDDCLQIFINLVQGRTKMLTIFNDLPFSISIREGRNGRESAKLHSKKGPITLHSSELWNIVIRLYFTEREFEEVIFVKLKKKREVTPDRIDSVHNLI